jgi:hypothetical protein
MNTETEIDVGRRLKAEAEAIHAAKRFSGMVEVFKEGIAAIRPAAKHLPKDAAAQLRADLCALSKMSLHLVADMEGGGQ